MANATKHTIASSGNNTPAYRSELIAVPNFPLVKPGDDLARVIFDSMRNAGIELMDRDIVAIASKVVSKAEGAIVSLKTVSPSEKAKEIANKSGKDPRVVELMLKEGEVVSVGPGVVEVYHRLGFLCTSAAIDRANVGDPNEELVSLLPVDPDASAQRIRKELGILSGKSVGVVINDSLGIKYRAGSVGLAIGVAGFPPIAKGKADETDLYGKKRGVNISFADEMAAAASLIMGQSREGRPIVILRGLRYSEGDGKLADLISKEQLERDLEKMRRGDKVVG